MPLAADALNIPAYLALVSQGALWGRLCIHRRNKGWREPVQSMKRAPEDNSLVVWCLADCRWKSEDNPYQMHYALSLLWIGQFNCFSNYRWVPDLCHHQVRHPLPPPKVSVGWHHSVRCPVYSKGELPRNGAMNLLSFVCCYCSSVVKLCLTPYDPMDYRTGCLLEFAQIHVHWVGDPIFPWGMQVSRILQYLPFHHENF